MIHSYDDTCLRFTIFWHSYLCYLVKIQWTFCSYHFQLVIFTYWVLLRILLIALGNIASFYNAGQTHCTARLYTHTCSTILGYEKNQRFLRQQLESVLNKWFAECFSCIKIELKLEKYWQCLVQIAMQSEWILWQKSK